MFGKSHGELGKPYADGEEILAQGVTADRLYVVQSGQAQAVRMAEGKAMDVTVIAQGEIFGLSGFFLNEPIPHAVLAKGDTRILTLDKKLFLQRIGEDPTLAFSIIKGLLARLHKAGDKLARFRLDSGDARPGNPA